MSAPRYKQAKVLAESPAVRFFFEHAGYSYPSGATKAQQFAARLECARSLAAAEAKAKEIGLVYTAELDECEPFDDGGNPQSVVCVYSAEDAEIEWPSLVNVHRGAKPLACLGGVTGSEGPYMRVIRAELAIEAFEALDKEVQEQADELAARATYAAGGAS